jgi:ferrous iron transport protein A
MYGIGDRLIVKSLDHSHGSCKRLIDMGLTPGTRVMLCGVAPLGDPFLFEIRKYRLAIRKKDLKAVEFDRIPDDRASG